MTPTLSPDEIADLTRCRRVADQLRVLHERGFYRATIMRGKVVVERAHYEAVCRGEQGRARPKVKPPVLRAA